MSFVIMRDPCYCSSTTWGACCDSCDACCDTSLHPHQLCDLDDALKAMKAAVDAARALSTDVAACIAAASWDTTDLQEAVQHHQVSAS